MTAPAPIMREEIARLAALYSLDILDTPAESTYERITALLSRITEMPLSALAFIDSERVWCKAAHGFAASELRRSGSLFDQALGTPGPWIVDTTLTSEFAGDPLVADNPGVRCFAGRAVHAPDGSPIGVLAVMSREAGRPSNEVLFHLTELAAWVETELALRQERLMNGELTAALQGVREALADQASIDPLTRLWNQAAAVSVLEGELSRSQREGKPVGVLVLDVTNLGRIADAQGHAAANAVIQEVAHRIKQSVRPYDVVGRYEGNRFVIGLLGVSAETAQNAANRLLKSTSEPVSLFESQAELKVAVGLSLAHDAIQPGAVTMIEGALQAAEQARNETRPFAMVSL